MKYLDFLRLFFDESSDSDNENTNTKAGVQGAENVEKKSDKADDPKNNDRTKPKYSDDDLDKILNKRFARWEKQKDEEKNEAARLATMNAQEKAEHERDKLQKELDELKKANNIAEMEKQARSILQDDGIVIADDLISMLVTEEAESTSQNVKSFINSFTKAVQDEVKKQLSHKKPTTGASKGLTKEDILKVQDPIKRQKLISENMKLFKK